VRRPKHTELLPTGDTAFPTASTIARTWAIPIRALAGDIPVHALAGGIPIRAGGIGIAGKSPRYPAGQSGRRLQCAFSPGLRLERRALGWPDLGTTPEPSCAYPGPSCAKSRATGVITAAWSRPRHHPTSL